MKKIGDYLIERLKLNDDSKIKKEDIIKLYQQNNGQINYGGATIRCNALWFVTARIEILKTLGKIIDNTNKCLKGCYLIFYSGTKQFGFHIYDSSFNDNDYVKSNMKSYIGTIRMYNIKKDEECNGVDVEFERKKENLNGKLTSSQLSIVKKLEAYIQPKNMPFNN